jgi:hypothetical protein
MDTFYIYFEIKISNDWKVARALMSPSLRLSNFSFTKSVLSLSLSIPIVVFSSQVLLNNLRESCRLFVLSPSLSSVYVYKDTLPYNHHTALQSEDQQ